MTENNRKIIHTTAGKRHGAITRLVSPGDLGEYIKPFVFLDYLYSTNNDIQFGYHPHSGIATLTYPLSSAVQYEDTTGQSGVVEERGLEWMQAGGGAWHQSNFIGNKTIEGFQLWLALPPSHENAPAEGVYVSPHQVMGDDNLKVLLGEYKGMTSLIKPPTAVNYFYITLRAGQVWDYTPPQNQQIAWFFVHDGQVICDNTIIDKQVAILEHGNGNIQLQAKNACALIFGSGPRHEHTLVLGRSSVHTSRPALEQGQGEIMRIAEELYAKGLIS